MNTIKNKLFEDSVFLRIFNKINNLKIFSAGTKIALVRLKEK